jgi:hypothetical protein
MGGQGVHRNSDGGVERPMKTNKFAFHVTIETHNQTGKVIAVYFQVRKGKIEVTKEYADGKAFADYDKHDQLLGIELLAPCRAAILDSIAKQGPTRRFVRDSVPRGMLVTA